MESDFNQLVRSRMESSEVTYQDLSDQTGYSIGYLSDILNGRKRWNIKTMESVGRCLGIEIKFSEGGKTIENKAG